MALYPLVTGSALRSACASTAHISFEWKSSFIIEICGNSTLESARSMRNRSGDYPSRSLPSHRITIVEFNDSPVSRTAQTRLLRDSANVISREERAASKAPRISTRASLGPDEIDEYAFVVVLQVGQFVGEVGEVVADASLQVLADVMVDRGQGAAAALI
jgi:hypothetical protein